MPLTLVLLRHAKSAWDDGVEDFDRPLSERGRREAEWAAQLIRARGVHPSSGDNRRAATLATSAAMLSARLPSALCAFFWCLAIGHFAWRRFGPAVAVAAAAILATSLGPMLIGRAATADALLNLLLTLSTLDLWRHIENGQDAPRLPRSATTAPCISSG